MSGKIRTYGNPNLSGARHVARLTHPTHKILICISRTYELRLVFLFCFFVYLFISVDGVLSGVHMLVKCSDVSPVCAVAALI